MSRAAQSPALVRGTLRQLAMEMDERLVTWLPLDDVLRLSGEYLARQAESAGVTDQILRCSIIRTDQGKLSFTHELLGRFLTLEGLRQAHPQPADLARQLKLPRHEDLPAMAVDLETGAGRAGELLAGLARTGCCTSWRCPATAAAPPGRQRWRSVTDGDSSNGACHAISAVLLAWVLPTVTGPDLRKLAVAMAPDLRVCANTGCARLVKS